ncbi:unnamed protein product [Prorocentrum cordatum]|uniref:Uncharacterized protein n=1 Tax=Prorocentrum cordatum TaxID=2364126 RepID=A0ABN9WYL5_9DINO|nr:unnamed protein product [Polarella glacialis]
MIESLGKQMRLPFSSLQICLNAADWTDDSNGGSKREDRVAGQRRRRREGKKGREEARGGGRNGEERRLGFLAERAEGADDAQSCSTAVPPATTSHARCYACQPGFVPRLAGGYNNGGSRSPTESSPRGGKER